MYTYLIKKIEGPVTKQDWQKAEIAKVDYVPWNGAHPYPYEMTARLLYTNEAIHVCLETNERPLTARYNMAGDPVNEDSCMEFFIAPNADDPDLHYFNIEINPLGIAQMQYCINRNEFESPEIDFTRFDIKSTITADKWQLTYKVPFAFLLEHAESITDEMYGNFYKCGDCSAVEHYACWSPILCEEEDFHRSEYFGKLILEKGIPAVW